MSEQLEVLWTVLKQDDEVVKFVFANPLNSQGELDVDFMVYVLTDIMKIAEPIKRLQLEELDLTDIQTDAEE